jgi:hypothetical protein
MNQKMKILIAYDGSGHADAAVNEVARRPWPEGSVVKVISAVRLPFTPTEETRSLPGSYYSQLEKAETEKAQAAVAGAVARLQMGEAARSGTESEVILGDATLPLVTVTRCAACSTPYRQPLPGCAGCTPRRRTSRWLRRADIG